jgi:hypothetical protein
MKPFKIQLLTAVWKRPEITRVCFEGIKRLQQHNPDVFDVQCTVAISELEMLYLCDEYGFGHIKVNNSPLGGKWNAGLHKALQSEFDYLMFIGSDDILSCSLLDYYLPHMEAGTASFGIQDLYVYSVVRKELKYFGGYQNHDMTIGAGRMIHRSVIEQCNGRLWKYGINRGCDGSALQRIRNAGFDEVILPVSDEYMVLDIKSQIKLNRFEDFKGKPVEVSTMNRWLDDDMMDLINTIKV